jgi:bifunctional DNA-binding transcriptional regulator/antitoxin component of YhaV-PrlF toxin-antitoxin module
MKVSSNGQVSIPAEARARWNADRVVVVDLGDRAVLRPRADLVVLIAGTAPAAPPRDQVVRSVH